MHAGYASEFSFPHTQRRNAHLTSCSSRLQHYVIVSRLPPHRAASTFSPHLSFQTRKVRKIDCNSPNCVHSKRHRNPCFDCEHHEKVRALAACG